MCFLVIDHSFFTGLPFQFSQFNQMQLISLIQYVAYSKKESMSTPVGYIDTYQKLLEYSNQTVRRAVFSQSHSGKDLYVQYSLGH